RVARIRSGLRLRSIPLIQVQNSRMRRPEGPRGRGRLQSEGRILRPVDVQVRAFPSADREFVAYVESAWSGLPEPKTVEAFQHALRARYPAAMVTIQDELARRGDAPVVWYAFRTGALGAPQIASEPEPASAWAILDDDRRFLEVSPALASIAEL